MILHSNLTFFYFRLVYVPLNDFCLHADQSFLLNAKPLIFCLYLLILNSLLSFSPSCLQHNHKRYNFLLLLDYYFLLLVAAAGIIVLNSVHIYILIYPLECSFYIKFFKYNFKLSLFKLESD